MSKPKKEKTMVTAADLIKATAHPGSPAAEQPPAPTPGAGGSHAATIVCDNLVKIYKIAELEVFALQGLDLVVNQGELLGIVGASGSGKSTLMNILGGLDRPSAGRIWVDGLDLLNLSDIALDRYRRTMVGFVWQQGGRNLIPYLNALENIELPMTLAGISGRAKRRRAEELLDAVSLTDRRKHRLSELSGGEQQRVAIAVALANNPHLLLADEPTGELDSNTALMIYKTFQDLNQRYGLTILIVSHDPTISRHVHRVVAIRDGKLATETVRTTRPAEAANGSAENGEAGESASGASPESTGEATQVQIEEILQELTVLDSAGRLQIPKDYLQKVNIKSRVTLEVTEEGILIRAAGDAGHAPSAEALGAALAASKRTGRNRPGYHRLLDRVMNVVNPNRKPEG
jgi:ABC-type lipoprotein export system ATPase subunit/bifunctional DNA-binding transcriptional regulator/antitoxin component of YhaV-PrlF toxin-antitoxin module